MPSSINSTSSSPGGLVSTGATDNELVIQTDDTTAISIDAAQNVTIAGDLTVNGTITGSSFQFITTVDLSNNATADFTLPSGYDAYQFVLGNVIPATDVVIFYLRTSSNGGSTFDAGISDYGWISGGDSDSSDSEIQLTAGNSVGSAAGEDGVSGNVIVYFPHLTKSTLITSEISFINTANNLLGLSTFGARLSTNAVDAVRFLFSSGNLESGSITLYGMKNS